MPYKKSSILQRGYSKQPTYISWCNMRQRCCNPKHSSFGSYGGRGISICERWKSFEAFYIDMGERPCGTSLERKDVNGGYSKDNCEWIPEFEQQANTRKSIKLTHNGKTQHLLAWSRELGIHPMTLYSRFYDGLPVELILSTHVMTKQESASLSGKAEGLRRAARICRP